MHNAINFTPEKGTVFLSAKKDKKNNLLLICVEDQGVGISQNDLDSLFKPFEQKDMSGGAGLGLTLVKNIVELHNGSIDVKSDKGQGTKISLLFPLS
jgi:signal transduction histidine kinase